MSQPVPTTRFADEVSVLQRENRVILFHDGTGRRLDLSRATFGEIVEWESPLLPPPNLMAVASRLEGLHMLRESAPPDIETLIPARSRRVLLFPDHGELWYPRFRQREEDPGFGFEALKLNMEQIRIWRACNGARTAREVAERTRLPLVRVLDLLASLTKLDVQAIQLRGTPIRQADPSLDQRVFDRVSETAVAPRASLVRVFEAPHPGMEMESYGERLHRALNERGLLHDEGTTLEMSSTDSHLVRDWLRRSTHVGRPAGELVRLDSDGFEPTSAPTPGVRLVEGSPQAIPLPASSVNLVLCTEIMSRLSAVPFDATTTANPTLSQGLAPAVAHAIETYELTHLPGRAWYNLGAWKLVEQIHRVLRPGGRAILVDRGELEPSTSSDTRNDPGSSDVHFGHLVEVARALGMEARTLPLPEFLDVRVQSPWLSKSSYEALEARMKTANTSFSPRAWTPETLNLPWPVEGIHWVGLADEGPGPLLTRMTVLLLRKP